jgi:tetratricopeptide (TPR) repeat protein
MLCKGAYEGETFCPQDDKNILVQVMTKSSQKDGIVERFIMNRCNNAINDAEACSKYFWQLLCYEVMYLWNLFSCCDTDALTTIIETIDVYDEAKSLEPFCGLSHFIKGVCYKLLSDYENSLKFFTSCVEVYNENINSNSTFLHLPAYACYEIILIQMKLNKMQEAKDFIMQIQQYKNFDFETKIKLKVSNIKSHLMN